MRKACFLILLAGCGCRQQEAERLRPIIDSHLHIFPSPETAERAERIFKMAGVERFCTKSAGAYPSKRFWATVEMQRQFGNRMTYFVNLDWEGVSEPGWSERECRKLEKAAENGARGVKIFKNLGLGVRDAKGKLLAVDDPRLDPIMEKAAELDLIVAIHTSDPKAFFRPPTPDNERYLELLFAPGWSFWGEDFPGKDELLAARNRLIARHPRTKFLGIHLANNPEDLDAVDRWLEQYPNLWVDISARVPEIGRHPAQKVRQFFIKHQERILFGSDLVVNPDGLQLGSLSVWPQDENDAVKFYRRHREYFETDHRQMEHPTPIQGDWKIDAINLPEEVLEKLYRKNALRLIWNEHE
jgi:predicted TIM-barrel fold metal-dependent hydrolase